MEAQTSTGKLLEYLLQKYKINTAVHHVNTFLAYIGSTSKKLNPHLLLLAKKEIFKIAQKYEWQMLMNHHQ